MTNKPIQAAVFVKLGIEVLYNGSEKKLLAL